MRTQCGLCGADPARGFASIGDTRYCHDGPSPTCYERAPWPGTDGANTLQVIDPSVVIECEHKWIRSTHNNFVCAKCQAPGGHNA